MTTICVISAEPDLARAIGGLLGRDEYRVLPQGEWSEDVARTTADIFDVVIVDAELTSVQPIRLIERIRKRLPDRPLFVFKSDGQKEWEEDAYLLGVSHVFEKPVRARLLLEMLHRHRPSTVPPVPAQLVPVPPVEMAPVPVAPTRALEVLRDYSAVLSHSLCAESLLKQFLLFIRRMMGVNRAGIFLRTPPSALNTRESAEEGHRLRPTCAIGLVPGILEHFELTLESGIGKHLLRHGRILRAHSNEAFQDAAINKEFELVGTQIAIPVLDRESLLGVAMFDFRLTGEPFNSEELTLLFNLLEQLGLAIRNIWLHDQLSANHDLMADALSHLSNGCVVVGSSMEILHANDAATAVFGAGRGKSRPMDFSDLPAQIGSRVFEVLKKGGTVEPFNYRPAGEPDQLYKISIATFERRNAATPHAALVLVEDFSQIERLQQLDIEAANLRLVKLMSARLAHEIGNSIVPLSTHQQLFTKKYRDDEFRASLNEALSDGVRRVSRLVKQMYFLARDSAVLKDTLTVSKLVEDAFKDAQEMHAEKAAYLEYSDKDKTTIPACEKNGIRYALAEIMLNALQSNLETPQVKVRTSKQTDNDRFEWLCIDVQDSGPGFTPETSQKGHEPFFTTRNVGVGLGLTVSSKIIEAHKGRLEIHPAAAGDTGFVRVAIPLLPPSDEVVPPNQVLRKASAKA